MRRFDQVRDAEIPWGANRELYGLVRIRHTLLK